MFYEHPTVGSKLDNGALVLAVRPEADEDGRPRGYVLAMANHNLPAFAEYVTWAYVIDERGDVTVAGHYHGKDLSKALSNLEKRLA